MELVPTPTYVRAVKRLIKLGATEAELKAVELEIEAQPEAGVLIRGGGGLRKMRFGYGGGGKSGGGRAIYYVFVPGGQIYLLTAYAKVDQNDITPAALKTFRTLVKGIDDEHRRLQSGARD